MGNYKQWKIGKLQPQGYYIMWRWSDSKGTSFNYTLSGKFWKTISGVTKFGLKHFGRNSENKRKI